MSELTGAVGGAARAAVSAPASEWTLRAATAGCLLGALLAAANVYTGLKTASVEGGSITASVLAFAAFAAFGDRRRPYSALETNLTQTIAASAGVMSVVAGVVGPIPALELAGRSCPPWAIAGWGLALGALGIVLAMALRGRLITAEALPFPTGTATAEVIIAMAQSGASALRRARALLIAALVAAFATWLRDGPSALVPQELLLPGAILGVSTASLSLGVSMSPLMFATGALSGLRAGASMLFGSLVAWVALTPLLVRAGVVRSVEHAEIVNWLMWPGAALVLSSSLTSLALQWRTLLRGARDLRALALRRDQEIASDARALLALGLLCAALVVAIAWAGFGLAPSASLPALALSVVLAGVCARAAGETDVAPVGTMGGVTQLLFGGASSAASITCGAIVAGDASQTAATLWALKAGERLRANPRSQALAQLMGALVGAIVVVPTYALIATAYGIGTERMPAPGALSWKATADAVQSGAAGMPSYAPSAALCALVIGCTLSLAEARANARAQNAAGAQVRGQRWVRLLPSPVAIGIAFLLPPALSVTLFLGAAALALASRRFPHFSETYAMSIAGGAIAGESLLAVALAALIAAGVLPG